MGSNHYRTAFSVVLEVGGCAVVVPLVSSRAMKRNAGSNVDQSLPYEGDCDCRISSYRRAPVAISQNDVLVLKKT